MIAELVGAGHFKVDVRRWSSDVCMFDRRFGLELDSCWYTS